MAKVLDSHNVSLTKNGYQKLNLLISKYPASEILNHLNEVKLDFMQALKMLAGDEDNSKIPEVWNTIKQYSTAEQNALLAISIIFSHWELIEAFKAATNNLSEGSIRRDIELGGKAYTNFAYALQQLGIASYFEEGAERVDYDWKPVFTNMKIGQLVKEVITHQLMRMGWVAPDRDAPFTRTFYEQSELFGFHEVFGLSIQTYRNWLEEGQINLEENPESTRISGRELTNIFNELAGSLRAADLKIHPFLQRRFISSLLSKPFLILTGLAGSGKTKLALAFAKWICESESQICIVPVGADWTNREPLLGYPNAIDPGWYIKPDNGVLDLILEAGRAKNEHKPYFLILDEMNLSHVERYFADFLSAMESNEAIPLRHDNENWKDDTPIQMKLSSNLFIIGTVNIDETTYMFSPKVLDRAQVIEFRISHDEMTEFVSQPAKADLMKLKSKGASFGPAFVQKAKEVPPPFQQVEELNHILLDFFKELKELGAEFGYRTASEIYRFAGVMDKLIRDNGEKISIDDIVDAVIMQKLLPKVHGSRRKLEPVLKALALLCLRNKKDSDELLKAMEKFNYTDFGKIKYPLSLVKIISMYKRLLQNSFTSFAEA